MQSSSNSRIALNYHENGWYFPIQMIDQPQAKLYRKQPDALEATAAGTQLGNNNQLNYPHVIFSVRQDLRYWGLEVIEGIVSAWLEVSRVNVVFIMGACHTLKYLALKMMQCIRVCRKHLIKYLAV